MAGMQQIERIRAKTPAIALDGSCVDEKLAEARAGLQIAAAELARLEDGQARVMRPRMTMPRDGWGFWSSARESWPARRAPVRRKS